jgi:large subunit ribosomal protein L20
MVRVNRGRVTRLKHKKILKLARGFRGSHSCLFRSAHGQISKSYMYAYISRRNCKRFFRRLFILRINSWIRPYFDTLSYSSFKSLLRLYTIQINLQMLSHMALLDPIGLLQVLFCSARLSV